MLKKLKEMSEITMGQSPDSKYYNSCKKGLPFIQGRTTFGRLFPYYDTWTTQYSKVAQVNDLLMSVRAPVGDLNFCQTLTALGRGVASIRGKGIDTKYLYYLLLANKDYILTRSTGSVYDSISKSDLENLIFDVHNKQKQQHIVNILGSLDDKIENNELKIQKLKVLLTSFFIKISLNKNKVCIVSLISEIKERLGKKELPAYSVINTGELISQDLYFDKRVHSKDMCKYKLIKQYDFAYNPSRINIGSIAMFEHLEGAVSPIYVAFKPKDEYKYYINEFVKTEQFNKEINLRANGSVRQSVNYDIFAEVQIPVPMLDELNGFNKTYQEISNKIKKLKQVNHKLSKLKNHYLRKFFG